MPSQVNVLFLAAGLAVLSAGGSLAQAPSRDPNLQSVPPQALQKLSDTRIRQEIMQESQAHYAGRCVCAYQSEDTTGRSCKGRHETVRTRPAPICYPAQVSDQAIRDWRKRHP